MPEPVLGGTASYDFPSVGNAGDFSISASGLLSGTRYYYRAYSENPEGVSYRASKSFRRLKWKVPHPGHPQLPNPKYPTGGVVRGWAAFINQMIPGGFFIPNWVGSLFFQMRIPGFGSGWRTVDGSGRMPGFIPSYLIIFRIPGSIFMGETKPGYCYTTTTWVAG